MTRTNSAWAVPLLMVTTPLAFSALPRSVASGSRSALFRSAAERPTARPIRVACAISGVSASWVANGARACSMSPAFAGSKASGLTFTSCTITPPACSTAPRTDCCTAEGASGMVTSATLLSVRVPPATTPPTRAS